MPNRLPFGVSTVLHVLKNFHSLLHILDSLLGVLAPLFLGPQTCRCRSELHDTIGIADCATHATYLGGDRYSPWPVVQSTCWYLDWDVDSNELMKQKLDGDMEIGGEVRSQKRKKECLNAILWYAIDALASLFRGRLMPAKFQDVAHETKVRLGGPADIFCRATPQNHANGAYTDVSKIS